MHGVAGLKEEKLQRYSNDFQLSILKRMREEQLSYRQTPALFDIRKFDIIGLWERRFDEGGFDVLTKQPKRAGRPKKKMPTTIPPVQPTSTDDESRSRDDLLAEVKQLRMETTT